MALELEPHHVLRHAADRREIDRLHRDGRAREADRDRSRRERPRVELRAQGGAGILRVDRECLYTITLDRGDAKTVPQHDDRKAERCELRGGYFHQGRLSPLTDHGKSVNGLLTIPKRPPPGGWHRCASGRSR